MVELVEVVPLDSWLATQTSPSSWTGFVRLLATASHLTTIPLYCRTMIEDEYVTIFLIGLYSSLCLNSDYERLFLLVAFLHCSCCPVGYSFVMICKRENWQFTQQFPPFTSVTNQKRVEPTLNNLRMLKKGNVIQEEQRVVRALNEIVVAGGLVRIFSHCNRLTVPCK